MKELGIEFEEIRIPLFTQGYKEAILKHSPTGKVPCLDTGEITIWDSLAICEYFAEQFPEKRCWSEDPNTRALARAICNEMHSGFEEIRTSLPMNCRRSSPIQTIPEQLQKEIDRIDELWNWCRTSYGDGKFLFGHFTIADAMYAPVVLRFNSYKIHLKDQAHDYIQSMLALESLQQWITDGRNEKESSRASSPSHFSVSA